jgi:uncharacterized membrane protein SpoIIM required for sporulation
MRENRFKFAEDMTAFGLFILGIILVVILMTSCSTSRDYGYQHHLRTTHHKNFISKDNGGCGWDR